MKPPLTGILIRRLAPLFLILVFPGLGYLAFHAYSAEEDARTSELSGRSSGVGSSQEGGFGRFLRGLSFSFRGEGGGSGRFTAPTEAGRSWRQRPLAQERSQFVPGSEGHGSVVPPGASVSSFSPRSRQVEEPVSMEDLGHSEGSGEDELLELQTEYEIALSRLFESQPLGVVPTASNPFRDALARVSAGGGIVGPSSSGSPADPPESSDTPRTSLQGRTPTGRSEESREKTYSFLVLGDATGEPRLMSPSPALLDQGGSFVLDNSMRVTPFLGSRTSVIAFDESDVVTTADVDGNGLMDFVVARSTMLGSDLRLYLQTSPRRFELIASSFLYRLYVRSLAVFDMTGDGRLEIVFAAEGSPHLLVFRPSGAVLDYYKEVVLPFRPGLLLDSATGGILREPRLHVLDSRMEQSVALMTRRGEALVVAAPVPLESLRTFQMDFFMTGGPGVPITVLENSTRVLITEQTETGHSQFASFERRFQVPLAIIGDFLGRRSRQLVILP